MTQYNDENINRESMSNVANKQISNVQVEQNPTNQKTLNNINSAGEKINNQKMGEAFVGAAKKVGGAAVNVGKSVGEFMKPSSGKVQNLVSKIPTVGNKPPQQMVSSQSMGGAGINFGALPRTGAAKLNKSGKAGRPRTKAVIKSQQLYAVGGSEADFERLLTLEDMTKGKTPVSFQPNGSPAQVPMRGLPTPRQELGFTSDVRQFTGSGISQDKTQQLRELSRISETVAQPQQLRQFTSPRMDDTQRFTQSNTDKLNMFLGQPSGRGLSVDAKNKLRRFL